MSDIEIPEESVDKDMAEAIPDVLGAVEATRPEQPEADVVASEFNDDSQLRHHRVMFQQEADTDSWTAPENNGEKQASTKETVDKFTQTFFKYMKNLSDKRFQEIINMEVNHDDKEVIFYRPSFNEFSLEEFRSFRHH